MKNIAIALALTSTAVFASVACGDSASTPANEKGGGGSAGASGSTATGGTTATGGMSGAATGGTAGAATGGASGASGASGSAGTPATGGTSGTGAEGGVGAEGGMGADGGMGQGGDGTGAGCPANEPTPTTMCGTRGLSCDFGPRTCRCAQGTGNWQCFDTNGDCPPMRDPGGNCMGGGTACSYGDAGTCVCMAGNFTCDMGVVSCPAMQPMDGAGCALFPAGFDCSFAAADCTCQAGGGGGMRTWNCRDSACPAMAPMGNSACPTPGLICDYTTPGPAADPTCVCNTMSRWTCL